MRFPGHLQFFFWATQERKIHRNTSSLAIMAQILHFPWVFPGFSAKTPIPLRFPWDYYNFSNSLSFLGFSGLWPLWLTITGVVISSNCWRNTIFVETSQLECHRPIVSKPLNKNRISEQLNDMKRQSFSEHSKGWFSCHRRKCSRPCFFNWNQSSDSRCQGFGAKFLFLKMAASGSCTGNPPLLCVYFALYLVFDYYLWIMALSSVTLTVPPPGYLGGL